MSRCFPFPPPGYERKNRPEDKDLAKEAERKEKKHKKEKRDKKRSKNKERKEKDGTGEKQGHEKHRKEKREDKKEKHKDRKDKEDRGKDREKSSISEESTIAAKIEKGGEKFNSRVLNYGSRVVDEEKSSTLFKGQNGVKPFLNNLVSRETTEAKFVDELNRRFRADETSRVSQLSVDGVTYFDTKDRETDASAGILVAWENVYNKDMLVDTRKIDGRDFRKEVCGRTVEEHKDRRRDGKERHSETGDVEQEDRHEDGDKKSHGKQKDKEKKRDVEQVDKHRDVDKKSHGNEKDKEKKREKAITKTENKQSVQNRFNETANNYTIGVSSNVTTDLFNEPKRSSVSDGNINKRKDVVRNGFLLESEIRPAKIQRLAPHQALDNGKIAEGCCTSSLSTDAIPSNVQIVEKERLINGVNEGKKQPPSNKPTLPSTTLVSYQKAGFSKLDPNLNKISTVPMLDDLIMEALRRSPHPDSHCLSEILTVPKLGEWSYIDDQEWLFSKTLSSNELKMESFVSGDELYVWSEAVHMKAADVCALPYVIPY